MTSDYIVEKRTPDGSFERFNLTHRSKIYQAKIKALEYSANEPVKHPILGKEFLFHGKVVTMVKVSIDWQAGYFYTGVYRCDDDSHGVIYFENINSVAPCILVLINGFKDNFKPLEG